MKGRDDLHPIPVPSKVWCQVGVDIMTMKSVDRYKYLITAMDYFSKNMEMRALRNKSAKDVALFLYEEVICRWGSPDVIITDQGREFCNLINEELMERAHCKHRITSAYHPQSNGLVERQNRTTTQFLLKNMNCQDDWVEMIPTMMVSHRHTVHSTTNCEPSSMLLGRKPTLAVNMLLKPDDFFERELENDEVEEIEKRNYEEVLKNFTWIKGDIYNRASKKIEEAQVRMKKYYDIRHSSKFEYQVEDKVLRQECKNLQRKGGKHERKFTGPYTIHEITDMGIATLLRENGEILRKRVPVKQLQKFYEGWRNTNKGVPNEDNCEFPDDNKKKEGSCFKKNGIHGKTEERESVTKERESVMKEGDSVKKPEIKEEKERESVKKERESVTKERESVMKERESVMKEGDSVKKPEIKQEKERESVKKERESVTKERESVMKQGDSVKKPEIKQEKERESVKKERESVTKERESVMKERESVMKEGDSVKKPEIKQEKERESVKKERESVTKERESVMKERESVMKEGDSVKKREIKQEKERESVKKERESVTKERESVMKQGDSVKKPEIKQEKERESVKKERESVTIERESVMKEGDSVKKREIKQEKERESVKKERESVTKERESVTKEGEGVEKGEIAGENERECVNIKTSGCSDYITKVG